MTPEDDESENIGEQEFSEKIIPVSPTYWSPLEYVPEEKIFDLDNEEFMNDFRELEPYSQSRNFKGWTIVKRGTFVQGGRTLYYKAVGLPTSTFWKKIAEEGGIFTELPSLSNQDEEE